MVVSAGGMLDRGARPSRRLIRVRATPRQAQILDLAASDLSDKQIAGSLGLSISTIRTHLERASISRTAFTVELEQLVCGCDPRELFANRSSSTCTANKPLWGGQKVGLTSPPTSGTPIDWCTLRSALRAAVVSCSRFFLGLVSFRGEHEAALSRKARRPVIRFRTSWKARFVEGTACRIPVYAALAGVEDMVVEDAELDGDDLVVAVRLRRRQQNRCGRCGSAPQATRRAGLWGGAGWGVSLHHVPEDECA